MKKLLLISLSALFLSACGDKDQYKEAVLAEMQKDQDLKDYKINPEDMTDCVIDLTSKKMPGVVPFDPDRMLAYRNYATMLTLSSSKDPEASFKKLKEDFVTAHALSEAKRNYAKSVGECLSSLTSRTEQATIAEEEENGVTAPAETPRVVAPKIEATVETPQVVAPKMEAPVETPQVEAPQATAKES